MAGHSSVAVFDLDDTLIDTRGVLLPAALRRVADVLGVDVARLDPKGKKIDEVLRGVPGLDAARREAAAAAWYDADAVPPLEPLPFAREVLADLRGRLWLSLLTRGDPARQARKLERCGLGPCFDEVIVRAIEQPGTKGDDLRALLGRLGLPAARCAVIGDDDRDELHWARALGCLAIKVPETSLRDVPALLARAGLL